MSYGLKCWTASGYVSFDSTAMKSYVKTVASGGVTLADNAGVDIDAPGYDYIYIFAPTAPDNYVAYEITKYVDYFRLTSRSPGTNVFGYTAFRL